MDFPVEEWANGAEAVKKRFYPTTGKSRLAGNAMAELDPQFAELIQLVARGRAYADPTIDLKTPRIQFPRCDKSGTRHPPRTRNALLATGNL